MKSNKSISRKNFFDKNPFFAISKMAKNQFLNWENYKTVKYTISRKIYTSFSWKILNFLSGRTYLLFWLKNYNIIIVSYQLFVNRITSGF